MQVASPWGLGDDGVAVEVRNNQDVMIDDLIHRVRTNFRGLRGVSDSLFDCDISPRSRLFSLLGSGVYFSIPGVVSGKLAVLATIVRVD